MTVRIDVVFDVPPDGKYHAPTVAAVNDAGAAAGIDLLVNVVPTKSIDDEYFDDLPDGVVIGPGSPYDAPQAAENVIRTAREKGLPLVAT